MPCDCGNEYDDLIVGTPSYNARIERERKGAEVKAKLEQEHKEERRHKEIIDVMTVNSVPQNKIQELKAEADNYASAFCKLANYLNEHHKDEFIKLLSSDAVLMATFIHHQKIDQECGREYINIGL